MKKLSDAKPGENGLITRIIGDERFLGRVTSMGLTIGCPIEVLQNEKKQPVLIFGRDTIIALNRKECEKIMIGGAVE